MAGIKIVDLPALGRDLAATDLLELSLAGGTGSRKITGQEIINASKLNVGTTPIINGTAGRILFQGTGNVLQQSEDFSFDAVNSRVLLGKASNNTAQLLFQYPRISSLNGVLWADNLNNPYGYLALDRGSGEMRMFTGGSYFPTFYSSNAERLRIATTGNVLINTTTDAGFKLDVNGTARIANSLRVAAEITPSASAYVNAPLVSYVTSSGWAAGKRPGISFWGDANSGVFLYFDGSLTFRAINDAGLSMTFASTAYVLANQPWAISGSNISYTAGNVGIGTSSPLVSLDVRTSDNSPITPLATVPNTATTLLVGNTGTNGVLSFGQNNTGQGWIQGRSRLGDGSSFPILLNPLGGNILIGTTTDAGYRLDVNGTARVTTRIDAGSFTPGAAASLYTFATTGRINAGGGIYFRTPIVGDTALTGFNSSSNDTQINVFTTSTSVFYFSGAGGSTAPMAVATPNFNPNSGTGDKAIFQVSGQYMTSGTYSGAIRGFYYNPSLTSMTGVTAHWAIHTTSGRVRFEGLPTSPTGLNAGDLWNDAGTLRIV